MVSREGVKIICLIIIIMDTAAAILGIEAELSQNKGKYMHVPTVECKAYAHTAYRFGITSAALLAVAHTVANLFGGCPCIFSRKDFDNSTADKRIAAATLLLSWFVLAFGLTLLVTGALMNSESRKSRCGLPHHPFLLIGGVLCFVHALSSAAYYVSSAAEKKRSPSSETGRVRV